MKYIVEVTSSNPSHEHVSLRRTQKKTNFVVEASNEAEALIRARGKFRSLGHYVHNVAIVEGVVPKGSAPAAKTAVAKAAKPDNYDMVNREALPDAPPKKDNYDMVNPEALPSLDDSKTPEKVAPGHGRHQEKIEKAREAARAKARAGVTEEIQYIEEKLTGADPASKWISDFVKSDNPKFAGKSKKERINMALGAYYSAKRSMKEEVEQVDEGFSHFLYTGEVNGKEYELTIPRNRDLGDYSDESLHRKLRKENPHLEHHEVTAIVDSGGEEESKVDVEHKGKKYTHHVINNQEPGQLYNEEVEQVSESLFNRGDKLIATSSNQGLNKGDTYIYHSNEVVGRTPFADVLTHHFIHHPTGKKVSVNNAQFLFKRAEPVKEEIEQVDEASKLKKLGKKYATADKKEKDKQSAGYTGKYPGGKEQKEKDKDAFLKRFANEEVEQIEEGDTGVRPGWMLKADPKLAAKVKKNTDKAKKLNDLMRKYGGKKKITKEEVEQVNELLITKAIKSVAKAIDNKIVGGRVVPSSGGAGGIPPKPPVTSAAGDIPKPNRPTAPEPTSVTDKPIKDMSASEYAKFFQSRATARRELERLQKTNKNVGVSVKAMQNPYAKLANEQAVPKKKLETQTTLITTTGRETPEQLDALQRAAELESKQKKPYVDPSTQTTMDTETRVTGGNETTPTSMGDDKREKNVLDKARDKGADVLRNLANKLDPDKKRVVRPTNEQKSPAAEKLIAAARDKVAAKSKPNKVDTQPTMPIDIRGK